MSELYEVDPLMVEETIEEWVITKCEDWRDHYESNYEARFEEYYRLWRGQWDPADSERKSERSRIISPALQQAVESNVAELEEATFGRGKWFDVSDNLGDTQRQDALFLQHFYLVTAYELVYGYTHSVFYRRCYRVNQEVLG